MLDRPNHEGRVDGRSKHLRRRGKGRGHTPGSLIERCYRARRRCRAGMGVQAQSCGIMATPDRATAEEANLAGEEAADSSRVRDQAQRRGVGGGLVHEQVAAFGIEAVAARANGDADEDEVGLRGHDGGLCGELVGIQSRAVDAHVGDARRRRRPEGFGDEGDVVEEDPRAPTPPTPRSHSHLLP